MTHTTGRARDGMQPYLHDLYAPLAHVPDLGDGHGTDARPRDTPTWVDDVDARRLTAYRVLAAMRDNVRRFWLPPKMWDKELAQGLDGHFEAGTPDAAKYREYGDPALLVDTGRALVLGDDQTIAAPALAELDEDATERKQITDVLDWVQNWAVRERFTGKLLEGEENTVGDGDGVYALGWSPSVGRPRLRVYDPGFYFPDLTAIDTTPGWDDDEYPPVVHVAWEYEDPDGVTWLRRLTWRMVPLEAPRRMPWGSDATWTCLHSIGEWRIDRLPKGATVYTLDNPGRVVREEQDILVDFIPVVHVPNDSPGGRHFGRSLLLRVAMVLDDLAGADTDLALNSELVASPSIVTSGAGVPNWLAGPGAQNSLPDGGSASLLDTSRSLDALIKNSNRLLERLSVNSRLALALLGRVQPNEVPSGYALELGFAPAKQLIREMRAVRDQKYPLILRFAVRLAQVAGVVDAGPTPDLVVDLGSSLPSDLPSAVESIKALLPIGAISTDTAVRVLAQHGMPIEDAEAEVTQIRAERFEDAVRLVEATGDIAAARKLLGLSAAAPAPLLPAPGAEPPAPIPPNPDDGGGE